jgi:D-3-phosphoglycerate dehydrogenase / 2-oxoglutarate reductase
MTREQDTVRILVLGDSYCPNVSLRPPLEELTGHSVTFADVVDEPGWQPSTPSESRLREYLGSPAQVIAALDGHEVLVVQGAPVSDAVMDAAPELRLICVARGGPVNVDVEAATDRGIPVVTTPGKNATSVAELTIAAMVMLARRVPETQRHILGGGELYVDNYEGANWLGHELAGHTLGLVGIGQIGRRVASRAAAFEMRVVAFDPFVPPEDVRERGAEPVSLDALLEEADHVSLHARATAENRGLLGAAQLGRMKRGAFLVNTARDVLVDEDALVEALRSGHLGGAALDVASPSPAGARHRLLDLPNVLLLPHIGGATVETLANGGRMAAAEITRFAAGQPLVNVANPAVLDPAGVAR